MPVLSCVAGYLQKQVWLLLSAILWLGNVEFDSVGDDSVTVRRDEALANAAELLNLDEDELATALTERMLTAGTLTWTPCLRRARPLPLSAEMAGWRYHVMAVLQLTTTTLLMHQYKLSQTGQRHPPHGK